LADAAALSLAVFHEDDVPAAGDGHHGGEGREAERREQLASNREHEI
jgi:hypothetical protein